MGGTTKIEWTATRHPDGTVTPGATFNPWIGCAKVSPACRGCYAESMMNRFGRPELWQGVRQRTKPGNWNKVKSWKPGTKVFCASLADVFEDHPFLPEWRADLWKLIEETPHLTWLLLTKRPENVMVMVQASGRQGWPGHVWLGTTVENQAMAELRIPYLCDIPAPVRFLSCEPMVGPVDLFSQGLIDSCVVPEDLPVEWVIAGGETGAKARPSNPAWFRSLRDQCELAGIPFHFKQHGDHNEEGVKVGKVVAGRLLDGREHNDEPRP